VKHSINKLVKGVLALAVGAVVVFGASTLTAQPATAGPILLCGPTFMWICKLPDGTVVPFNGTVCEKLQYEKLKGARCVLA
jgi:hypothetical protein